jgi:hypothetical protein
MVMRRTIWAQASACGILALALIFPCHAQQIRLFGETGSELHLTPANPRSPLNPGDILNIERRADSSDLTLFGDVAPESKRWKLHLKLRGSNEWRRSTMSKFDIGELNFNYSVSPWLDLTIGRKIERWGTGYAWNPTGVVNPRKDPTDPNDRRSLYRGVDMLAANLFVKGWTVTLLGAPEISWSGNSRRLQATGWAARAYKLIGGTDVAFTASGGSGLPNSQGLSLARVFGNALELHAEAAYISDSARLLPRNGGLVPVRRPHAEILAGGQYTLKNNINVVAEYYHAGQGLSEREWSDFGGFARDAARDLQYGDPGPLALANSTFTPLSMSKDYSFLRVFWPIRLRQLELETIVISSLRDGSSAVRPGITWRPRPDWDFYCIYTQFIGNAGTDFGHIPIGRSADIGIRYHFSLRERARKD